MLWRFCPFVGFLRFYLWMYVDLMTCILWWCMIYIRCDCWELLQMHVVGFFFCWRCSVYFLNKCFIRVYYRFNWNRALQVGIGAWLVLSRLVFVEFPVCTRMVLNYIRYLLCCSVLLGEFEFSGGVAGCFRFVGLAREGIFGCGGSVGCGLWLGSCWFWIEWCLLHWRKVVRKELVICR